MEGSTTTGSTDEGSGTAGATTEVAPTTGGTSTGGTSTGDEATGPTTGGSSETGAETGAVCELPPALPYGPGVQVEVTNEGADPVFFNASEFCAAFTGFKLFPAGSDTPLDIDRDCQFSCGYVASGAPCECDPGCIVETIYRLDPGKSLGLRWDGSQLLQRQLSEACASPECGLTCYDPTSVPEGSYELLLTASSTAECEPSCDCAPNEDPCTVTGLIGPDDRTLERSFEYPAQTELALVFE